MRPLGDEAACVISFPDPMHLHTPSVLHFTSMQILHLYFRLHVGARAKGFGYLMCSREEAELPKGYSPPLPAPCSGAVVLASLIGMSSGMLRSVQEQGRMLPISPDHPSTGALPLLPQGRGAADLQQELTGTAQLP